MSLRLHIQRAVTARAGISLIEMMVGLSIGTLIIGVALFLFAWANRTFASVGNYDDLNRKSRNALDVITSDIRQAQHLTGFISNSTLQQLVFTNMPGASSPTFSYSYSKGALTRTWGGQSKILLTNLTYFSCSLSQRNPASNFTFVATSDPTATKLINLNWICSLPVSGTAILDTESIQTAKIVVRN